MRERRTVGRRAARRSGGPAEGVAAAAFRLWARATQRPIDFVAILAAAAATVVIVVNAIFLQSNPHPAPFFANPASAPPADNRSAAATAAPKLTADQPASARPALAPRAVQPVSARRNDPIGDLIGTSAGAPSPRLTAVQRALSAYGYGQIRPSGVLDEATSAAIEKFESEHKMQVTGRVSDRLLGELAAMIGRPVD